jgi:hypothetical protein
MSRSIELPAENGVTKQFPTGGHGTDDGTDVPGVTVVTVVEVPVPETLNE